MEKIASVWENLEKFVGYKMPEILKHLLWMCGYDSMISVKELSSETIQTLEIYIQKNRNKILAELEIRVKDFDSDSCLLDSLHEYEKQEIFQFLPGHQNILLTLRDNIQNMMNATSLPLNDIEAGPSNLASNTDTEYSVILSELLRMAKSNANKSKHANQYSDIIKYFSTYIFLLCGRTCYETLNKNLPIPSTKTILRCINNTKECIEEGKPRFDQLCAYLQQHNAGNDVWICEDGSGLIPKISYDPSTNQLIGMTLPIDEHTGCPKIYESTTRDEEEIKRFCSMTKSTHLYLILAIPLKERIPPYVLQIFGTDNRFTARNVVKRWKYTINELKRRGIRVRGFSSDGDSRLLSAMRSQIQYSDDEVCYMQDGIHGGLKLRTCFLRSYAVLPMGIKQVSVVHLKMLIREFPKMDHGLVLSDVSPVDRQNFKSLEKCMSIRVREALQKYIPDSEATGFFLKLCFEITSSLISNDLTPYERIETMFHAIFFLRIWRKWILQSSYSIRENFITNNAYICAEINAANLLKLIRIFRNENKPELFLTSLFDSQACERAFRQFRSMGTPNYTKINFTLLELLFMVRRLEVQNELLYSKLSGLNINLPKLEKKRQCTKIYMLPNEEEIFECINRAKRLALIDAAQFGMEISSDEIDACEIPLPNKLDDDDELNDSFDEDEIENNDIEDGPDENTMFPGEILEEDDDQERAFITITDHLGRKQVMRKSTYVWLLSEGTKKISSDRLIRVQEKHRNITCDTLNNRSNSDLVFVSKHIKLGDWCIFRVDADNDAGPIIYIGLLHAFRFGNQRLVKEKIYKFDSVNLEDKPNLAKELEVLSTWYLMNDKGVLIQANVENHSFLKLENYVTTISISPTIDSDTRTLFFPVNDFKEIEEKVLKIMNV